jgi:hypothetical protein
MGGASKASKTNAITLIIIVAAALLIIYFWEFPLGSDITSSQNGKYIIPISSETANGVGWVPVSNISVGNHVIYEESSSMGPVFRHIILTNPSKIVITSSLVAAPTSVPPNWYGSGSFGAGLNLIFRWENRSTYGEVGPFEVGLQYAVNGSRYVGVQGENSTRWDIVPWGPLFEDIPFNDKIFLEIKNYTYSGLVVAVTTDLVSVPEYVLVKNGGVGSESDFDWKLTVQELSDSGEGFISGQLNVEVNYSFSDSETIEPEFSWLDKIILQIRERLGLNVPDRGT